MALSAPNACQSCHTDKPAKWAADQVQNWYGHAPAGFQKIAQTFSDAQQFAPGTDAKLVELLRNKQHPPIVRATAARAMGSWLSQQTVEDVGAALEDEDPLVRMGALEMRSNWNRTTPACTTASAWFRSDANKWRRRWRH